MRLKVKKLLVDNLNRIKNYESIYLEYGKNLNDNILEQIKDLNKKVLDFAVPRILVEIKQHNTYIKDASNIHMPMERSMNVSNKGSKTLYRDTLF